MMGHTKSIHKITFLLVIIGGINWLLVGFFNWDIGALFGGMDAMISRVIYILVGVSALYEIATHKNNCRACTEKSMDMKTTSSPSGSDMSKPM